ncbi:MAG: T9SS type A sorting domain-containing protein [Bacteroidota bacterium]
MKLFAAALLVCILAVASHAQVQVMAWTDRLVYEFGDTVSITVQAYNPTPDTVTLIFSSSCQVSYTIDGFRLIEHVGCLAVVTSQRIPPQQSYTWPWLHYPFHNSGWPLLLSGTHTVIGEVLGYGASDTLLITVTTPTSTPIELSTAGTVSLSQNYPNPFNPSTHIAYSLTARGFVTLRVFNSLGQAVATLVEGIQDAGEHEVIFDGSGLASGVYLYRLRAGDYVQTRRLVLVR